MRGRCGLYNEFPGMCHAASIPNALGDTTLDFPWQINILKLFRASLGLDSEHCLACVSLRLHKQLVAINAVCRRAGATRAAFLFQFPSCIPTLCQLQAGGASDVDPSPQQIAAKHTLRVSIVLRSATSNKLSADEESSPLNRQ